MSTESCAIFLTRSMLVKVDRTRDILYIMFLLNVFSTGVSEPDFDRFLTRPFLTRPHPDRVRPCGNMESLRGQAVAA